jgi:hypothetical protein
MSKNQKEKKPFVETIKYMEQPNKVEIEMQIEEGKCGQLLVYIFNSKFNLCNSLTIPIRLLCNYTKVPLVGELPVMNEMQVKGVYTKSDMHMWIYGAIPDTCERTNDELEQETYLYYSKYTNTYLQCTISKNNSIFYSDNLSSIVVLQKHLISVAYETKKVNLSVQVITQECTFKGIVQYIMPKLQEQARITKDNDVLLSLKEMKSVEGCILTEKYEDILKSEDKIKKELPLASSYMSYYSNIILALYDAKGFINGKLINNSIEDVNQAIKNGDTNLIFTLIAKLSN